MSYEFKIPNELIISTIDGVIELYLKPRFIELNLNATGLWLESLSSGVDNNGNGVIYGMDYTYFLEHGRKPGNAPPVAPLVTWVNAKLGIGGSQAVSIAWAIRKKIEKEGTSHYPDGEPLLEVLQSKEVIDYIYSQLQEGVTVEINKILIKQLNDNFS